ncbi:uncharacterized protein LOC119336205 isoform X3 [Triticum dicoccoides]|uniref:uncharacterized protein LOC119336205 isoform X3 n=1 Tax=Triticum dicoccoides TaxID=85692 RepID=UPI001891D8A5|nr:uncharacterized protein LOC119336205 isoform X3 [Triticum dicoccoides]XP_037464115.1 uncharacterized protein LOC119336205 isoform X3 [Triticum dicoccoides]
MSGGSMAASCLSTTTSGGSELDLATPERFRGRGIAARWPGVAASHVGAVVTAQAHTTVVAHGAALVCDHMVAEEGRLPIALHAGRHLHRRLHQQDSVPELGQECTAYIADCIIRMGLLLHGDY